MRISDLLRLALDNLRRRKGRTALTVIGVVVGSCAIVVMISLGIAVGVQNEEMLRSWGDLTEITVYNYGGGSSGSDLKLDDAFVARVAADSRVVAATPYYQLNSLNGNIYAGRNNRYQTGTWNIYGLEPGSLETMGFTLKSGRWLDENENLGRDKIPVLVGQHFGYEFFDTKRSETSSARYRYQGQLDANGNELPPFVDTEKDRLTLQYTDYEGNIKGSYELVVVGVLEENWSKGYFSAYGLVMGINDARKLEEAARRANKQPAQTDVNYNEIHIKVDTVDNVAPVEEALREEGYNTNSMTQIREELQANVAQSQMILGGLAAISLLVAALNIMNTMTMAIYERTREIGVMKVLGCELWQIRSMFLIESGAIGFLGGLVGVVISFAVSALLNNLALIVSWFGGTVDMSWISQLMGSWFYSDSATISIIPPWLVALALAFATVIGVLSGIAPAGRAVKISALEAIRHE